jgi:hypothetical protein
MKQVFLVVSLIFLALPASGRTKTREVDLRVNGVGSKTRYAIVIRKLGKPSRTKTEKSKAGETCSGLAETDVTLIYPGLEIRLLGYGRGRPRVFSIEVTSKRWLTSGIHIGADIKDVRNKFGKPDQPANESNQTLHYVTKDAGRVDFYFQNNKLVRVEMEETNC